MAKLKEGLEARIEARGVGKYRDAIFAAAEPCSLFYATHQPLRLEREWIDRMPDNWPAFGPHAPSEFNRLAMERLPIGASRLGGLPDLPRNVEWPTCAGAKVPLIAQLDLHDLPRWSECRLPASGWLLVFFAFEAGLDREPCIVLHVDVPREQLQRAPWPREGEVHRDWGGISVYDILPLRPELSLAGNFTELGEDDESLDALLELDCDFYESSFTDGRQPVLELLGKLTSPGTDPVREARNHRRSETDWVNLVEVQSVGSMMWSDAGNLNVLIRNSALFAGDFSDVLAVVNSG